MVMGISEIREYARFKESFGNINPKMYKSY